MESQVDSPQVRSWRDIPQELRPRAMSSKGRRRYLLSLSKLSAGIVVVGLLSWGVAELVSTLENNPRQLARATEAAPVASISVISDGVLGREWVAEVLSIPKSATLMELNLSELETKLTASGQVRGAVLVKNFPSTLSVRMTERIPVARILAEEAPGRQARLFVARDGVVFKGQGYDVAFTDSLPWLSGFRLARSNGVLQPIEGMPEVAELLAKAKYEAEHLYPLFQILNLSRLRSDGVIEVSSPELESVVFSARGDYFRQLALLDAIRDTVRPTREAPLARVDLSLGNDVPVAFRPAGDSQVAKKASEAPAQGPLHFNFQRKATQREL